MSEAHLNADAHARAVLGVLARSQEPLGWYRIEVGLMNVSLPERGRLPEVLREMRRRGWVAEDGSGGVTRYVLTASGRSALGSSG